MHRSIVIAAAAAFLGMTPAAGAQTPEPPAEINTKYFFQCADAVKVRNNQGAAPWTTAAPTTSYTAGGGCGFLDTGFSGANPGNHVYDAVFEGTHTGPVSDLTVELHDLVLGQSESTTLGTLNVTAILEIDGVKVLDTTEQDPPVEATPTTSASGLSQSIKFSVNNLKVKDEKEHSYRLTIGKYYVDTAAAWVFGATEIPAGIEFNPLKTVTPVIKAPNTPPAVARSAARKASAKRATAKRSVKRAGRASARR